MVSLSSLSHEVRQAVRQLRKSPGFSVAAVLTLALGIGGATAIYSVVRGVVLDPLPYPSADRMVRIKNPVPRVAEAAWNVSSAQYFHLREHATSLEEVGAFRLRGANVRGSGQAQRADVGSVTASTLRLIGARAAIGRVIEEDDDRPGAADVVVLSHGFWQREFGGDPGVVGGVLDVDETPYEVLGVMEAGVHLPGEPGAASSAGHVDLWRPYRLNPDGPFYNDHGLSVIGRWSEGVALEDAQEEVARLTSTLPEIYPQVYWPGFMDQYGFRAELIPLQDYVLGEIAGYLWILFGAVGLVLLIAAANVANLFLVRAEGRRRELAVRAALGAGRAAVARHFLAESLTLAVAGGALALVIGLFGVDWLVARAPANVPRLDNVVGLDAGVFFFAAAVSLLTGAFLAVFPLVRYGRVQVAQLVGQEGRSATSGPQRQRVRSGLVATQVAFALVLIVAAGLLIESFQRLRAVDPGINPEGAVSMLLPLPPGRYDSPEAVWRFHSALLERVEAMAQVTVAGAGGRVPLTESYASVLHAFDDPAVLERLRDDEHLTTQAGLVHVSPGYFEALGIPLLAGRTLTRADLDQPGAGAAVVSEAFAERYWPGEDPLGKGILPGGAPGRGDEPRIFRVVGVVGNVRARSLEDAPEVAVYYPIVPLPGEGGWWQYRTLRLIVRSAGPDPTSVVPAVRAAVHKLDPTLPVAEVETLQRLVDRSTSRASFTMVLLLIAAAVALILAAVGLYGVVSYLVARRTAEIGIRVALGAGARQVERLVVGGALAMVGLGLAGGIGAAVLLTRLMRGVLYDVEPTDPLAYVVGSVVLCGVALVASYVPARRAARVDPMVALRSD